MVTRLVTDQPKLKVARRYAQAKSTLLRILGVTELPAELATLPLMKGPDRKAFMAARKLYLELSDKAVAMGVAATDKACLNPQGLEKQLQRLCRVEVEVSEAEVQSAAPVDYRGFQIVVHDFPNLHPYRFRPTIMKDGTVVRDIHVRSKDASISVDHLAKRAIDYFLTNGQWPTKQGVSIPAKG